MSETTLLGTIKTRFGNTHEIYSESTDEGTVIRCPETAGRLLRFNPDGTIMLYGCIAYALGFKMDGGDHIETWQEEWGPEQGEG